MADHCDHLIPVDLSIAIKQLVPFTDKKMVPKLVPLCYNLINERWTMTRPRIEGMDEKIISSFVDRKIFSNQREVITAALRALVREQKAKEALEREAQAFSDETYKTQLNTELEKENASVGNTHRSAAIR